MTPFADRREAGQRLAERLSQYRSETAEAQVLVLALPRGGVPVAYEVADALGAALDVFVVRKIGVPVQPELAMGAIASGGVVVKNYDVMRHMRIDERTFERVAAMEKNEVERRERFYRGDSLALDVAGKICIIVDDGIATGATMQAAVIALRALKPRKIVVAAPVAAPYVPLNFANTTDEAIFVYLPPDFTSVGLWYEDFAQTEDDEVFDLLRKSKTEMMGWIPRHDDDAPSAQA